MNQKATTAAAVGLILVVAAHSVPAMGAVDRIELNYNFNGIVHAGESGLPDDPFGFRSISDRGLDFSAGLPSHPILDEYRLEDQSGRLDIVHLGNRNTVAGGIHMFDDVVDGDNIGVQPDWLADPDQSGPQTTTLPTSIPLGATALVGVIFQISNDGGSFDVRLGFTSGPDVVGTLTGPDWFAPFDGQPNIGSFPGTENVDLADPGAELLLTEGFIDLGAEVGRELSSITFENPSNATAGYAIVAVNVYDEAPLGACCLDEFCTDTLTEAICVSLGGTWFRNETCPEFQCPQCVDEYVTAPGTWTGSTCGAGDDCDLRDTEEYMFEVDIPEDGNWTFSFCDSTYDTYIFIGSTCCTDDIAFQDDSTECGLQSHIVLDNLPAGRYYVNVEGFNNCGDFTLEITGEGIEPLGACCVGEACTDGISEVDCLGLSGTWYQGLDCTQVSCSLCPWDIDGDDAVTPFDSNAVMANFGCTVGGGDPNCDRADIDGDGFVNPFDSNAVMANFGPCP